MASVLYLLVRQVLQKLEYLAHFGPILLLLLQLLEYREHFPDKPEAGRRRRNKKEGDGQRKKLRVGKNGGEILFYIFAVA